VQRILGRGENAQQDESSTQSDGDGRK
jgi:hypothetical protein